MTQARSPSTRSPLIAQLLTPVVTADRKFLAELKRELLAAWELALFRFQAAQSYWDYCAYVSRIARIERKREPLAEKAAEQQAQLNFVAAIDRLMHLPAPTIGALRHKQKYRLVSGGRDRWEAAIAADEARLL